MTSSGAAAQRDLPTHVRALDAIVSDYADVCMAQTDHAADTTPEEWARAALDEASAVGRFVAWRVLLGLRLEPQPSPDRIAGWRIADRAEHWIRLEARSWFMTANIVLHVNDGQVTFATFVRYDRPIAARIWTPVSAIHRRVAPDVLRAAARRIDRRRR